MYFYKGLFFCGVGRGGGSADSHPAHNSRDIKCYFLMIFNVRKKLYFNAIRAISCILTKGCFLCGRKGGSADSHPAHNSRDIKCYFLMIFMSEKSFTSTRFAPFAVFLQRVVFYEAGRGGPRFPTRPIIRGI